MARQAERMEFLEDVRPREDALKACLLGGLRGLPVSHEVLPIMVK